MYLQRLTVDGLRNLSNVDLRDFAPVNIFFGQNGSGKTSLLEAINLLSVARSFRSNKIAPIVNHERVDCTVYGVLTSADDASLQLGVTRSKSSESIIKANGRKISKVSELADCLPLQIVHSDSFHLIDGGPSGRRRFLDWGVFHVEHSFFKIWSDAQRCLKHRNSLLRHGKIRAAELDVWDVELAKLGEALAEQRHQYFEGFAKVFQDCLSQLIDLRELRVTFSKGWESRVSLYDYLVANRDRDANRGHTIGGPHRADLHFRMSGSAAAEVLSRGQQKLVVYALQLAQGYYLQKATGRRCIYLLDDLPAELDGVHRKALCKLLAHLGVQVFVTCVDFEDLRGCWAPETGIKMFHVEQGKVYPSPTPF